MVLGPREAMNASDRLTLLFTPAINQRPEHTGIWEHVSLHKNSRGVSLSLQAERVAGLAMSIPAHKSCDIRDKSHRLGFEGEG